MYMLKIDEKRCKACGLCAAACPRGVIGIDRNRIEINGTGCAVMENGGCIGCRSCTEVCPDIAITITYAKAEYCSDLNLCKDVPASIGGGTRFRRNSEQEN